MYNCIRTSVIFLLSLSFIFTFSTSLHANDLTVSNVSLGDRNPSADTVVIEFDVAWNNSWKTKINHDAAWLTVRLYDPTVVPTDKKLCQMTVSGLNPAGTSNGSNSAVEIYVPEDKYGAFLRPSSFGLTSSLSSSSVQLTIDYTSCGFEDEDHVYVNVMGIEMVYIPQGAFYAGDYDTSTASLHEGSSDSDPWYISSESTIAVTNATSNGYRYVSAGNAGEDSTGTAFTIPASFPKGYDAFYTMKYEITEGQWIEFINSLGSGEARNQHDITDGEHKNTDTVQYRNTVSCSGSPLICSTERPARVLGYISWMDLAAFLDWAALRPMTELEYEKMARGPLLAIEGEFAWGGTDITAATTISAGIEDGTETITNTGANVHYDNQSLSGGDTGSGSDYQQGPLRVGIFATSTSDRENAGAGYYGVMDLAGNVRERVVTIGNSTGRSFEGTQGDGILSTASGYEGNADESDWAGIDAIVERGVTGADGSGFKGGAWDDEVSGARLRISDRHTAAYTSSGSFNNAGGRGVRTYDGD